MALIHFNDVKLADILDRIKDLRNFRKPIVCNEDDRVGKEAGSAAELAIDNGASYGLMLKKQNQTFPFTFAGSVDDIDFYSALGKLTRQ